MVHHTTLRRKPNKTNKTKKGGNKGKRFSKTKPYSKKAKSVRVRQRRRRTVARRKMRGGVDETPAELLEDSTTKEVELINDLSNENTDTDTGQGSMQTEVFLKSRIGRLEERLRQEEGKEPNRLKEEKESEERANKRIKDAHLNLINLFNLYNTEKNKFYAYKNRKLSDNYPEFQKFRTARTNFYSALYYTNFININNRIKYLKGNTKKNKYTDYKLLQPYASDEDYNLFLKYCKEFNYENCNFKEKKGDFVLKEITPVTAD